MLPLILEAANPVFEMDTKKIMKNGGMGKSHGFSRVAAGTWGIFSSYRGDVHSKL